VNHRTGSLACQRDSHAHPAKPGFACSNHPGIWDARSVMMEGVHRIGQSSAWAIQRRSLDRDSAFRGKSGIPSTFGLEGQGSDRSQQIGGALRRGGEAAGPGGLRGGFPALIRITAPWVRWPAGAFGMPWPIGAWKGASLHVEVVHALRFVREGLLVMADTL